MSSKSLIIDLLSRKCQENGIDVNTIDPALSLLGSAEPISHLFGIGMAPENPSTLVNLWILTKTTMIDIEFWSNKYTTRLVKLSSISKVSLEVMPDKVIVRLNTDAMYGIYLVNRKDQLDNVRIFVRYLVETMPS